MDIDRTPRRRWAIVLAVVTLVLSGASAAAVLSVSGQDDAATQTSQRTRDLQLLRCGTFSAYMDQLDCYNRHFDQVREEDGITQALSQLVQWHNDQRSGPFSNHCHEVLHTLGQGAMLAAGEERSARVAVFADAEVTCTGGFVHGALTEFMGDYDRNRLDRELLSVCPDLVRAVSDAIGADADPTGWLSWNCDHVVGHAIYWVNTESLVDGADWCKRFDKESAARAGCEAGFFMEHYLTIGRNPGAGLAARPTTPDEVYALCRVVDQDVAFGCWKESGGSLYLVSNRSWAESGDHCRRLAPNDEMLEACYIGLAHNIAPYAGFEPPQMRAWCAEIGDDFARETCAIYIAGSMAMELAMPEQGLEICTAEIADPDRRTECEMLVTRTDVQLSGSGFGGGVGYSQ